MIVLSEDVPDLLRITRFTTTNVVESRKMFVVVILDFGLINSNRKNSKAPKTDHVIDSVIARARHNKMRLSNVLRTCVPFGRPPLSVYHRPADVHVVHRTLPTTIRIHDGTKRGA